MNTSWARTEYFLQEGVGILMILNTLYGLFAPPPYPKSQDYTRKDSPRPMDRAEVAERTKAPLISKTVLQDGLVVKTHSLPKFIIYYHSESFNYLVAF